ncbi:hypothetical protein BUALT_Bualt07G0091600 [Buddleja alternifolia]|uniref:DDE Tnp4 domain-containing protein n=1 Tax=Buddleja alternifolia TaxID=168488 RepID=A0AAV6XAM0_9LAMI|nr:hypothetical protein BUALT_Bualt07G0091600 [Buddleja alternifolia]
MSRSAFGRLYFILENVGGLVNTKNVQGCLRALDGTYLPLLAAQKDEPHYRNRKGDVSTNVLAMCDINTNYVYMLCCREGSVADNWVLKDAITRDSDFRVSDERSFAIFKGKWAISWSNLFYPMKVHNRIIMACALLHNYIRVEMPFNPLEAEFPEVDNEISDYPEIAFIEQIKLRIGFEHDASSSRKAVFEVLGEVWSLFMEDIISVSQLIVNNNKNIDLFFSSPSDGRVTMVKIILEGKLSSNEKLV